jgi:hypothetical protein
VITADELNRATLARQFLLRREALPAADAVRRLVALQAQEPASPYLALWNRLDGFDPADFDAILTDRAVVKGTLMRVTLHAVHAADYRTFREAMEPTVRGSPRPGSPPPTRTCSSRICRPVLADPEAAATALPVLIRRYLAAFGPASVALPRPEPADPAAVPPARHPGERRCAAGPARRRPRGRGVADDRRTGGSDRVRSAPRADLGRTHGGGIGAAGAGRRPRSRALQPFRSLVEAAAGRRKTPAIR